VTTFSQSVDLTAWSITPLGLIGMVLDMEICFVTWGFINPCFSTRQGEALELKKSNIPRSVLEFV
jgi:hypothetical protein